MRFPRWLLAGFLVLLMPAAPADTAGARAVVAGLDTALLGVMRDAGTLGYAGRYERLTPVLTKTFDLSYIIHVILRRYWKGLDARQRAAISDVFRQLTIATYADRFDGYAGEQFKIVSEKPLRRGRALVRSELRKADGDVVRLDYVLRRSGGRWAVVNVVADGVSDLALKRVEYGTIMRRDGFAVLVRKIDSQVARYRAEAK